MSVVIKIGAFGDNGYRFVQGPSCIADLHRAAHPPPERIAAAEETDGRDATPQVGPACRQPVASL
jgi:hypothetical protein